MTSIVYPMILFIVVFGAGLTFINESGMYAPKMPVSGVQAQLADANSTAHALQASAESNSVLGSLGWIVILGKSLWGGVVTLFTLGYLLEGFGIPASLTTFLISPLPLVVLAWLAEFWLGRASE